MAITTKDNFAGKENVTEEKVELTPLNYLFSNGDDNVLKDKLNEVVNYLIKKHGITTL